MMDRWMDMVKNHYGWTDGHGLKSLRRTDRRTVVFEGRISAVFAHASTVILLLEFPQYINQQNSPPNPP